MFNRLKNNGIKILVFIINILLMVVAVLVISEKDQMRLLGKAQDGKKNLGSENVGNDALPSFGNSASVEAQEKGNDVGGNSGQVIGPSSSQIPVADNTNVNSPEAPTLSSPSASPPAQNTKPADRKTKTS